jgi:branched-chain amino acid transport system permease protein
VPVSLVPLVGGLAGMLFAVLLGFVTTKKAGTPFAMITLGIGELVFAMSLMFPEFFGGEGGVTATAWSASRSRHHLRPQIQVYYLIALYTLRLHGGDVRVHAHAAGPHAQRRARQPRARRVHRLQHAARALPRLHHRGLLRRHRGGCTRSTSRSSRPRWSAPALGRLSAVHLPRRRDLLLRADHRRGADGARLVLLSEFTKAWLLYLGLIFLFMVMYAPGGIASLIMMNLRVAAFGKLRGSGRPTSRWRHGARAAGRRGAMIEMVYHLQLNAALGPELQLPGRHAERAGRRQLVRRGLRALRGHALFELARRSSRASGADPGRDRERDPRREAL